MMPKSLLGSRSFCFQDADPKVEATESAQKKVEINRLRRRRSIFVEVVGVKLVQAGFWANHFGDLSGTFGGIMCAA